VMKIYLLFYMCHFAMGLTHCYKTTVFLTFMKSWGCWSPQNPSSGQIFK